MRTPTPLFPLGQIVATPAALATFQQPFLTACLTRHHAGDWGETGPEDALLNTQSIHDRSRILSVYHEGGDKDRRLWIITEADRSVTTLLLPEDY